MPSSYLMLCVVLIATGVAVCAAAASLVAFSLLRPPRMTDAKALTVLRRMSPGDLGMRFEDVSFRVRDDRTGKLLKLAGWWIPADSSSTGGEGRLESPHHKGESPHHNKCVVLLHGYADAKVGAIAWAPVWRNLGFHVLALDLRAHGESEGAHFSAGYFERHDVAQAIDQLRAERPEQTRQIILFGPSSGAAVALATAALPDRPPPDAVVIDSPYAGFREAAAARMEQLGLPSRWLGPWAVALAERWSGADFAAVRPVELIARVQCPVLAIVAEPDPYLPPADAAVLEAAMRGRPGNSLVRFANVGHLMSVVAASADYQERIARFVASIDQPADGGPQIGERPISGEVTR